MTSWPVWKCALCIHYYFERILRSCVVKNGTNKLFIVKKNCLNYVYRWAKTSLIWFAITFWPLSVLLTSRSPSFEFFMVMTWDQCMKSVQLEDRYLFFTQETVTFIFGVLWVSCLDHKCDKLHTHNQISLISS